MKRAAFIFGLLSLYVVPSIAAEFTPPRQSLATASPIITIPVMANTPGALGGVFKTKVVLYNPTSFAFPIEVSLYGPNGFVKKTNIDVTAGQIRNYANFLQDVFSYQGAGTVNFDSLSQSGGNSHLAFLVSAEVYIESEKGRFQTVVTTGPPLDPVSPGSNAYSLGITVDANTRTNIGCFNTSFSTNIVNAELYDASSHLVTIVTLTVAGGSWVQAPLPNTVTGGYIRWRPTNPAYCYAVVVNNTSNDGTFISAVSYTP